MKVLVTGATGFLGRYIVHGLIEAGHTCRCWYRPTSDRTGLAVAEEPIEWVAADLDAVDDFDAHCEDVDAVVHSALHRPGHSGFRAAAEGGFDDFMRTNLTGSLALMQAARRQEVGRFVLISSCSVHEVILPDRTLDETHPLWPTSHYGAHKAALEMFVHSFGRGEGWPICSLRPTGIYGAAHPARESRWFEIVQRIVRGEPFRSDKGGKEVHARDVAAAVNLLLEAGDDEVTGQAFNCYDQYIAEQSVAVLAKDVTGSRSEVIGNNKGPKNQIDTSKIRQLGMTFGGMPLLRETVAELVEAVSRQEAACAKV